MKRTFESFIEWWPALLVIVFFAIMGIVIRESSKRLVVWIYPDDQIQILERFDAYNYQMRLIHVRINSVQTTEFHARFCDDFEPPFSAGETLILLTYYDRGSCWELKDREFGYKFLRDAQGNVVLAPNCSNGPVEVVCHPVKNKAQFEN